MSSFKKIFILFFIGILIPYTNLLSKKNNTAQRGVLDLSEINFSEDRIIPLTGEWEFYWKKLLTYNDISENRLQPEGYIKLPDTWNNFEVNGRDIGAFGYATFHLKIILGKKREELALKIPHTFSSYNMYVNDKLISSNGKVATNKADYTAQTLPKTARFIPDSDSIDIILQIANFSFVKGGAPATISIGSETAINSVRIRNLAMDIFVFGALFITGIYHFALFLLRRKDLSTLFFSLFCLFLSFRTIALGETFFIELLPDFSFDIHVKLLFAAFFLGAASFVRFLYEIFPHDFSKRFSYIYSIISIISALLLIVLPLKLCGDLNSIFQLITAVYIIYFTYILIRITIKKNDEGLIALMGLIILVAAGANDILYDNQIINTGYYGPYGLVIFIFSQSTLLAIKFSKAFTNVENLTFELTETNITFKKFVPQEFLTLLNKVDITKITRGEQTERSMTIMFADIRSFTELSEKMKPQENFNFINSYLDRMAPIIRHNHGFIDKFIGDAIMALFPNSVDDAVKTAIEMQKEINNFNDFRQKLDLEPIKIGIGLHYGSMMLGVIGESERFEGTVISDAVNVASHVESLTKIFGNRVIITDSILENMKDKSVIKYRFIGKIFVKKRKIPVPIYEVYSCSDEDFCKLIEQTLEDFESAVKYYNEKRFSESVEAFNKVLAVNPNDHAAQQLSQRAKSIIKHGPEARPSDSIYIFKGKKG